MSSRAKLDRNPGFQALWIPDDFTRDTHERFQRWTQKNTRFRGVLGDRLWRMRTGDGEFRAQMTPRRPSISVAKLSGSLSLSIRLSEGPAKTTAAEASPVRAGERRDAHRSADQRHVGEWGTSSPEWEAFVSITGEIVRDPQRLELGVSVELRSTSPDYS